MGQSSPTVRQSKARRVGGGAGFFSTHKPTACAARVACPGNLAALKPPLHTTMHFESSEHYIQKTSSLVANCKTVNHTIDLEMLVVFVHGHGFRSAVNYFVYTI